MKDAEESNKRVYYLDWQRAGVCWGVVMVHAIEGMRTHFANWAALEQFSLVSVEMKLQQIGMPLLFISAGKTFAASRSSGNFVDFLFQKSRRLVVPFVLGYLLFIVPSAFIEPRHYECVMATGAELGLGTLLRVMKCVGPWWLWFLPALYFLLLKDFFLLKYLKSIDAGEPNYVAAGLSIVLPLGVSLTLMYYLPITLLVFAAYVGPYFIIAFFCRAILDRWGHWGLCFIRALFPISSVLIAANQGLSLDCALDNYGWTYHQSSKALSGLFYSSFIAQGFVETFARLYHEKEEATSVAFSPISGEAPRKRHSNEYGQVGFTASPLTAEESLPLWKVREGKRIWMPLFACLIPMFSIMGVSQNPEDLAYSWAYPPFQYGFASATYLLGTWCYWLWWEIAFSTGLNYKFNEFFWKHSTDSTFVIYISHGLGVTISNRLIVMPLGEFAPMLVVLPLTLLFSFAFAVGVYAMAIHVPLCRALFGLPARKKRVRVLPVLENTEIQQVEEI